MSANVLAFVPARANSQGIPGKNLAEVGGKSLVAHTFELVQTLGDLVAPFVSTDSEVILHLAGEIGFPTDYLRPSELATDESLVIDAVLHALDYLADKDGKPPSNVLLLQPTCPLRSVEQVERALECFDEPDVQSLVSVCEMREHPYECVKGLGTRWSYLLTPVDHDERRQDFEEKFYYVDGSIYLATADFIRAEGSFLRHGKTILLETDVRYSVDIDEPEDLVVADALIRFRNEPDERRTT